MIIKLTAAKSSMRLRLDLLLILVTVFFLWTTLDGRLTLAGGQEESVERPETPVNVDLQRRIRLLQRKLNSEENQERDDAERELIGLGPAALDYLPNEDPEYSAEFNARIRRVRLSLELETAKQVTTPKAVTLKGAYTMSELAQALQTQTGNNVRGDDPAGEKFAVDWENLSFFEALDDLKKNHGRTYQLGAGAVTIGRPVREKDAAIVSYSGGFRTEATSIQATRNLALDTSVTRLDIALNWEPRFRLIKLQVPFDQLKVTPAGEEGPNPGPAEPDAAERDDEVQEAGAAGKLEFGIARGETSSYLTLPIEVPAEVRKIDVRGKYRALIAGRNEVFRFDDLAKALEEKQAIEKSGIRIQLDSRTDDEYLTGFQLTVSFADAKKSLESHYGWVYENPVYLIPPQGFERDGVPIGPQNPLTVESAGQTEETTSMLFLFDKMEDTKGWTLEYHSPGVLVETEIPFRLKNIRLP